MSVDKGGLRYTIETENDFSAGLSQFRSEVREAREEWAKFKKTLGRSRNRSEQRVASDLRSETREIRRKAKAQERLNQAERIGAQAKREYNTQTRRQAVEQSKADIAEKRRFANERRLLQQNQQRAAAERRVTKVLNEREKIARNLQAVQSRGIKLSDEEKIKLGLASRARKASTRSTQKQTEAERALNRVLEKRQRVTQLQNLVRDRGVTLSQQESVALGLEQRVRASRAAGQIAEREDKKISGFLTRVVKAAAAYALVRALAGSTAQLVRNTVDYNAELEIATLSIASLIISTGDVRDSMGDAAESAEALAVANEEADKQVLKLRRDALLTAATFQELVTNYQTAIGPGVAAGFDLDEIRKLTVRLSQAAAAIGLPQNQLSEEIRSLLTGTIQPRQTRIATVLGITNDDVRRAKEAGRLYEFLEKRLEGFGVAGEEALETFRVLQSNTADAFLQVAAEGSIELFDELKGILRDVQGILVSTPDASNVVKLDPTAVLVVERVSRGLKDAVGFGRQLVRELASGDLVDIATAFGDAISVASFGLASATRGVVEAGGDISSVLSVITGLAADIGAGNGELSDTVALTTRLVTLLLAASGGAKLITSSIAIGSRLIKPLVALVSVFSANFLVAAGSAATVGIGIALATQYLLNFFDTGLTVRDLLARIAEIIRVPITAAMTVVSAALDGIKEKVRELRRFLGFREVTQEVQEVREQFDGVSGAILSARQEAGKFSETLKTLSDEAKELRRDLQEAFAETRGGVVSSGASTRQLRTLSRDRFRLQELTKNLVREEADAQRELVGAKQEQQQLQQRINKLSGFDQTAYRSELNQLKFILDFQEQVKDKKAEINALQAELVLLPEENSRETLALNIEIVQQMAVLSELEEKRNTAFKAQNDFLKRASSETRDLVKLAGHRLATESKILALNNRIRDIKTDILTIENRIAEQTAIKISQQAVREATELQQGLGILAAEAAAAENAAGLSDADLAGRELAGARAVFNIRSAELALAQRIRAEEEEGYRTSLILLQTQRDKIVASQADLREQIRMSLSLSEQEALRERLGEAQDALIQTDLAILNVEEVINSGLVERNELLKQIEDSEQRILQKQLEQAQLAKDQPVEFGFAKALEDVAADAGNVFEKVRNIFSSAIQGIGNLISTTIRDAFDPTTDTSLKERLGNFLLDFGAQVISMFAQIAAAKAAFGLAGLLGAPVGLGETATGAGISLSGLLGFDKGGRVPRSRGRAKGGVLDGPSLPEAPAGLDRRDKIPFFGREGEFVVVPEVARKVGYDWMDRFNRGDFDLSELRDFARADRTTRRVRSNRSRGFAEGGRVGSSSVGSSSTGTLQSPGPGLFMLPVKSVDQDSVYRELRAGRNGLLRLVQEIAPEMREALKVQV